MPRHQGDDLAPNKEWRSDLWIRAALVAMVALAYWPSAHNDFINFDDDLYIFDNPPVRAGLTWSGFAWAWSAVHVANWHPLSWLSHMLDCELFGLRAGAHHLVSVMIHALNALVLLSILQRMTGSRWRSALVAALFAVHPLNVESVAWAVERKSVLCTLFGFLAIGAYVGYARRGGLMRYLLVLAWFGLSLLSKPALVTLPCALLLLDIWPLRHWPSREIPSNHAKATNPRDVRKRDQRSQTASRARLIIEKLPLLAMSAASSAITVAAQHTTEAVSSLELIPLRLRLLNAVVSYATYLVKAVAPFDLAIMYPHPFEWPAWRVAVSAGMLIAITGIAMALWRRRPALLIGWLWYLGTMAPMIGVVQVGRQAMADRYAYVPLIGVFMMIAWSLPDASRWRSRPRLALGAVAAAAIAAIIIRTHDQVRLWRSTQRIFTHALAVTENNYVAHNNLGEDLLRQGDRAAATWHFEQAIAISPDYPEANANLGAILMAQGGGDKAERHLRHALRFNDRIAEAHAALGTYLAAMQRLDEGRAHLERALAIKPHIPHVRTTLGQIEAQSGDYDRAAALFQEQLRLDPNDVEARRLLELVEQARAALRE